jgi:hypothetical protein
MVRRNQAILLRDGWLKYGYVVTKWLRNEKRGLRFKRNPLIYLVRPAGFEPAAYGFEVRISEFPNPLNLL